MGRQGVSRHTAEEDSLLRDAEAVVTIAVKNVDAAKRFYAGTLRFKPQPGPEPGVQM